MLVYVFATDLKERAVIELSREWALRMFGADGVQVRALIPQIIRGCHEDMADAQQAARMQHAGVYGYIWRKALIECASTLGKLPGAMLTPVPRAGYSLVSFGSTVLFPWRYSREAGIDIGSRRFSVSEARQNLFHLDGKTRDLQLDVEFDHPELSDEETKLVDGLEEVLPQYARVVVVGYASNPLVLHDIQWGEAVLAADGTLTMVGPVESLMRQPTPTLAGLGSSKDAFSQGAAPAPILERRDAVSE